MKQFTSWSPSRLTDYDQCPRMSKYKALDKLCPACFKGRLAGGFDTPAICDTCGKVQEIPAPIARGSAVGDALDAHLLGKAKRPPEEIRHPKVLSIIGKMKDAIKKGTTKIQLDIVLTKDWKVCKGWDKGAWLRAKLDLVRFGKGVAEVVDWKTGGIDKRTGQVRAEAKYDDQLGTYAVAVLSAFPDVKEVTPSLVFLDCGPRFDPFVKRPEANLSRAALPLAQKRWEKRVLPMFKDEVFAPRPGDKCRFCDYSKSKDGPCEF